MAARYKSERTSKAKNIFLNVMSSTRCSVSIWSEDSFGQTVMTLEQMQELRAVVNKAIMLMKFELKQQENVSREN